MITPRRLYWLAFASLTTVACEAVAQNGAGAILQEASATLHANFVASDKNKDDFLTRHEAEAGKLPMVAQHFDAIDTDHAGLISEKQIQAWFLAQAQMRYARPAQPAERGQ